MSGLFITFEGMDGVGKSTQIRLLSEYLRGLSLSVYNTREPGGCPIAEKIRDILLSKENAELCPRAEALLYAAARAQHIDEVIRPRLAQNDIVISDRFLESSLAYQGGGRMLGTDAVMDINRFAVQEICADKIFFLCLDPEKASVRMNESRERDRIESESLEYHRRVFDTFIELSRKNSRIEVVDVSGTKQETAEKIRIITEKLLCDRGII